MPGVVKRHPWTILAYAVGALLAGQIAAQLLAPDDLLVVLRKEGPVEVLTLASALVGAGFALAFVRRGGFFVLWAVCCFVFAMEETSWLREYLHYEVPGWMRLFNAHGDSNFHNRTAFGFDLMLVFRGSFFLYFVVLPWIGPLRRHAVLGPLLPPRAVGAVFAVYMVSARFAYALLPCPDITALSGNYREEGWELVASWTILYSVIVRGLAARRTETTAASTSA